MARTQTAKLTNDTASGEATDVIAPEQSIGYQIRLLHQEMTSALDRLVGRHGISGAQWGYLRHIYFDDGLTQRELSDRIGRQGPTTVTALRRLEQSGYVRTRRAEHDQRKNNVHLTPLGRELVEQLMPHVREVEAVAFQGFSATEIESFWQTVARMRANLRG